MQTPTVAKARWNGRFLLCTVRVIPRIRTIPLHRDQLAAGLRWVHSSSRGGYGRLTILYVGVSQKCRLVKDLIDKASPSLIL